MGRTAKTAKAEKLLPLPLQFLAAWIGMWVGEQQARVIEYQRAENAALLERLGKHRLRLTDGERRRLAKLGKALGRKALQEVATLATPDTILRWYRELVAAKYDGARSTNLGGRAARWPAEFQSSDRGPIGARSDFGTGRSPVNLSRHRRPAADHTSPV